MFSYKTIKSKKNCWHVGLDESFQRTKERPWSQREPKSLKDGPHIYRDGRPEEAATRAARTELGASRAGGPAEEPNVDVQEQIADDSADNNSHIT
jgi:hypothetical protein